MPLRPCGHGEAGKAFLESKPFTHYLYLAFASNEDRTFQLCGTLFPDKYKAAKQRAVFAPHTTVADFQAMNLLGAGSAKHHKAVKDRFGEGTLNIILMELKTESAPPIERQTFEVPSEELMGMPKSQIRASSVVKTKNQ